jgi:small subunit ribosomal protein S20
MAHHKSAIKKIRQNAVRRLRNRYRLSTTKTAIKKLEGSTTKADAQKLLPGVESLIDKCVKRSIFHRNKAARMKSRLHKKVNALA